MTTEIKGGINIAMKVPSHQYEAVIAFYRDIVGLPPYDEKAPAKGFLLGPNRLWIDEAPHYSQAEIWLELSQMITRQPSIALQRTTWCAAIRLRNWARASVADGS